MSLGKLPPRGSPPHMRGKVSAARMKARCDRITPAYAGKSPPRSPARDLQGDHPRICGEKKNEKIAPCYTAGSPPHMRGKANLFQPSVHGYRITPAYAGKRRRPATTSPNDKDHPRICGEKKIYIISTARKEGSPPHMRGKGSPFHSAGLYFRITPAYAGKSPSMHFGES